jgi:chromosome segregation ATPase
MNQPIEQRFNKIEQRLDSLEKDRNGLVENEKILLRLARLHRLSLQELKVQLELDIGDLRERFDTFERKVGVIEQTMAELRDEVSTAKGEISTVKATQGEHGELLKQILARLEPK